MTPNPGRRKLVDVGVSENNNPHSRRKRTDEKRQGQSSHDDKITDEVIIKEHAKLSEDLLPLTLIVRLGAFIVWTGGILYATYHVYMSVDEHLPFQTDPVMNPGYLSSLLGRGRDPLDSEWNYFFPQLWTKFLLFYAGYKILTWAAYEIEYIWAAKWTSTGVSIIYLWDQIGITGTVFMLLIPILYWVLMQTNKKWVIWVTSGVFVFLLNTPFVDIIVGSKEWEPKFGFVVMSAWGFSRAISFCFDVWDRPEDEKFSIEYLGRFIQYLFYFPLVFTGPLVLYHHYEKDIILKNSSPNKGDLARLLKQLGRMMAISFLNEIILHTLHHRVLSNDVSVLYRDLNLWTICGLVYWLGQFFTLKYKVMYGIPSCLAEFDGLTMYPLPCCPAYLHRYSVLWKDFDRGLYLFLVRYIYIPSSDYLRQLDQGNRINSEVKKLIASLCTFIYVYAWHSTAYEVFIWAAFNFLGITIEKFGSNLKKKIDKKVSVAPVIWDFIVEPIVTVPLAAMSIMNSTVFCGSLVSSKSFMDYLWNTRADSYVIYFLYAFTHVSVTVRNWNSIKKEIAQKINWTPKEKLT